MAPPRFLNPLDLSRTRHHEPFENQEPHNMASHPRRFEPSTFILMNMETHITQTGSCPGKGYRFISSLPCSDQLWVPSNAVSAFT
jgi:hypothetical protein